MIERITQIMEREGLTPSKFAEAIGIQRSAMSHILNGRNNVSLDVLIKNSGSIRLCGFRLASFR